MVTRTPVFSGFAKPEPTFGRQRPVASIRLTETIKTFHTPSQACFTSFYASVGLPNLNPEDFLYLANGGGRDDG